MLAIYLQLIDTPEGQSEFEKLYYKYRKLMYYIALDIVKDVHLAEDVVSETFMSLAKNFDKIRKFGEITCPQTKRYIVISVKHTSFNMLRNMNRYHETLIDDNIIELKSYEKDALDILIEEENIDAVLQALNDLPEKYKEVLQLYAVCECDADGVAESLGINKATVYKRLQRARKLLEIEVEDC